MSKQIKLKSLLKEGYAWERKPGKPLPTIQEVMDEFQATQETKEPVKESITLNDVIFTPKGKEFFLGITDWCQAPDFDMRESFNAEYLDGFFNNGQDIIRLLAKAGLVQSNNDEGTLAEGKDDYMDAQYISQITGCGLDSAQNFIDEYNLDSKKLAAYVKMYRNSKEKYDVRDYITGTGLGAQKNLRDRFIKNFKRKK
jgi:hypothetical protein